MAAAGAPLGSLGLVGSGRLRGCWAAAAETGLAGPSAGRGAGLRVRGRGREGLGCSRPAPLHPKRTVRREVQVAGDPGPPHSRGAEGNRGCAAAGGTTRGEGGDQAPRREGETASPSHGSDGGEILLFSLDPAGDPQLPSWRATPLVGDVRCSLASVRLSAEQDPLLGCERAILNLF